MFDLRRSFVSAWALTALLLAGCVTSGAGQSATGHASSQASERWVGTWGASPTVPPADSPSFEKRTLRLIAHTSIGGDEVRVRLSNPFGTKTLVVSAATIGLQGEGAALVGGSLHPLTFGGNKSISIPPGALMVSDAVDFKVPAQRNLAVNVALGSGGPASLHPGANQKSYVSGEGDFSASVDAAPFNTTLQSWPLLSAIEVRSSVAAPVIVTFGDSITDGYKSTVDANRRWPDYLAGRLFAAGRPAAIVNEGISGNRILHDASVARIGFGPNALSRFDRDALSVSGATHIVVLIGINDIGMGNPATNAPEAVSADDLIAGLRQFIVRAHAQGLKIVGATLTPFSPAAYFSPEGEVKRQAINRWIRSSNEFDAVFDFDAATRDPKQPAQFLPAYDSGDHLHPNDAGYEAMAKSIDLAVFGKK